MLSHKKINIYFRNYTSITSYWQTPIIKFEFIKPQIISQCISLAYPLLKQATIHYDHRTLFTMKTKYAYIHAITMFPHSISVHAFLIAESCIHPDLGLNAFRIKPSHTPSFLFQNNHKTINKQWFGLFDKPLKLISNFTHARYIPCNQNM